MFGKSIDGASQSNKLLGALFRRVLEIIHVPTEHGKSIRVICVIVETVPKMLEIEFEILERALAMRPLIPLFAISRF
jgi:hypothetical protein